jgi:hypothetical protein
MEFGSVSRPAMTLPSWGKLSKGRYLPRLRGEDDLELAEARVVPPLRADPGGTVPGRGSTVRRNIYFYRLRNADGSSSNPLENFQRALREVCQLPFRAGGRYLDFDAGARSFCVWVHRGALPLRIRLADIRRSDLPLIDREGRLRPLALEANEGVAEGTHVVVFADGYVGCEFNFYGPRLGRISSYLVEKAPDVTPGVEFDPVIYADTAAQLRQLQSAKSVSLRIPAELAAAVREADPSLGELLSTTAERLGAPTVAIQFGPEPRSRSPIGQGALDLVRGLFQLRSIRQNAIEFTVTGLDREGRISEIDLLGGRLVAEETMIRQDSSSRAINSLSAYRAIESARATALPSG